MKYMLVVILVSCLFGCGLKEVSIDFPPHEPVPVVNCIFKQDSILTLTISKTQPVLEKKDTEVADAIVELYEDGLLAENLEYSGNGFKSTLVPKINSRYSISITIPQYEELIAEDYLPTPPTILNSTFRDSVYTGDEGDLFSQVEIILDDPPGIGNYYELILAQKFKGSPATGEVVADFVYYDYTNNELVLRNEGQLQLLHFVNPVFSDELFDGRPYTLRINYLPSYNFYRGEAGFDLDYDLIVTLRGVSKNYYDYNKSLLIHLQNQDGDVWGGVGEPTEMFTNIQNGYGIFAGFSQVIDTIQKK